MDDKEKKKKSQPNRHDVTIKALSKKGGLFAYTIVKIAPYGGGAFVVNRILDFADSHWQQLLASIL